MEFQVRVAIQLLVFTLAIGAMSQSCSGSVSEKNEAVKFAAQLQTAVIHSDSTFISNHLEYPIAVYLGGNRVRLYNAATASSTYSLWMTPYLYHLIVKTQPDKLVRLLDLKKENGTYLIHKLLLSQDLSDFRYSGDGIYSARQLNQVLIGLKSGAAGCVKCLARVVSFPLRTCVAGHKNSIMGEAELIKSFPEIVTPAIKSIMAHAWQNGDWKGFPSKGIMLGANGEIWIQSLGHKAPSGLYVWETKVTAINAGCYF